MALRIKKRSCVKRCFVLQNVRASVVRRQAERFSDVCPSARPSHAPSNAIGSRAYLTRVAARLRMCNRSGACSARIERYRIDERSTPSATQLRLSLGGVCRLDVRDQLAPASRRQSLWDCPPLTERRGREHPDRLH